MKLVFLLFPYLSSVQNCFKLSLLYLLEADRLSRKIDLPPLHLLIWGTNSLQIFFLGIMNFISTSIFHIVTFSCLLVVPAVRFPNRCSCESVWMWGTWRALQLVNLCPPLVLIFQMFWYPPFCSVVRTMVMECVYGVSAMFQPLCSYSPVPVCAHQRKVDKLGVLRENVIYIRKIW